MMEFLRTFSHWLGTIAPALFVVTLGGVVCVLFAVWFARWVERKDL